MTNEDIRKPKELKDVAAGQVLPAVQSSTPGTGGQGPNDGSTPDAGDGRISVDELATAHGANIAHPLNAATPGSEPSNPNPNPGPGLGIEALEQTAAGNVAHPLSAATPGSEPSNPDPNPGPGLGIEQLEQTAAGATALDAGTGGPPPNPDPDPGFDPPPGSIGGGVDITPSSNAGQTG